MPKDPSTKATKTSRKASEGVKKRGAKEGKGKGRGKKDPNAPKKPLSAYMFFSQDWRERVKGENPEATFGEMGKILGAKWKELDEDEKKPYHNMAENDKKRYEEEKKVYESGSKDEAEEEEDED